MKIIKKSILFFVIFTCTTLLFNSINVNAKYHNNIFYNENNEKANWWHDDGTAWYFFQNGIKHTGYAKDNAGNHFFAEGKYANWWHDDGSAWYFFQNGQKHTGYAKDNAGNHFFAEGKYANWWHDDGSAWYFFQNGQKHTGYAKDNAGNHYFVNGKYANGTYLGKKFVDGKEVTVLNGYVNGIFYSEGTKANWWNDDGTAWYFFQNGLKYTGYAKDNAGNHFFAEGKYANWWNDDGSAWYFFQNGQKHTGYAKDNAGNHYFVNGKYANGVYDDKYFVEGIETEKPTTKGIVFLDPGHGGIDSGAYYNGIKEKEVAFKVYQILKSKLEANGYGVKSSRTEDVYVDFIKERSQMANSSGADIFISLHFNSSGNGSGGANGIETYWYEYDSDYPPKINKEFHNDPERLRKSQKLANAIHKNVLKTSGATNRNVRRATFAVVRETKLPAILIELGYLDNAKEASKIKTDEYLEKLAQGLYLGIVEYYQG